MKKKAWEPKSFSYIGKEVWINGHLYKIIDKPPRTYDSYILELIELEPDSDRHIGDRIELPLYVIKDWLENPKESSLKFSWEAKIPYDRKYPSNYYVVSKLSLQQYTYKGGPFKTFSEAEKYIEDEAQTETGEWLIENSSGEWLATYRKGVAGYNEGWKFTGKTASSKSAYYFDPDVFHHYYKNAIPFLWKTKKEKLYTGDPSIGHSDIPGPYNEQQDIIGWVDYSTNRLALWSTIKQTNKLSLNDAISALITKNLLDPSKKIYIYYYNENIQHLFKPSSLHFSTQETITDESEIEKRDPKKQVKADDLKPFLDKLDEKGIKWEFVGIPIRDIIPLQKEIKREKVDNIKKKIKKGEELPPVIVAKDNHLADGHHRLISLEEEKGKDALLPSVKVDADFDTVWNMMEKLNKKGSIKTAWERYPDVIRNVNELSSKLTPFSAWKHHKTNMIFYAKEDPIVTVINNGEAKIDGGSWDYKRPEEYSYIRKSAFPMKLITKDWRKEKEASMKPESGWIDPYGEFIPLTTTVHYDDAYFILKKIDPNFFEERDPAHSAYILLHKGYVRVRYDNALFFIGIELEEWKQPQISSVIEYLAQFKNEPHLHLYIETSKNKTIFDGQVGDFLRHETLAGLKFSWEPKKDDFNKDRVGWLDRDGIFHKGSSKEASPGDNYFSLREKGWGRYNINMSFSNSISPSEAQISFCKTHNIPIVYENIY